MYGFGVSDTSRTAERRQVLKSKIRQDLRRVGVRGLQQPSRNPRKTALFENGGAQTGALDCETGSIDADLLEVVSAWPDLPDAVRGAVLRIVAEARQGSEVGGP